MPLAEALIARGEFTDRQVWQRVRLLLEAGAVSAGLAHRRVPAAVSEMPDRGKLFEAAAGPKALPRRTEEGPVAARDARTHHVRRCIAWRAATRGGRGALDAETARAIFRSEDQGYVWGQLALQAARHNLPEALEMVPPGRGGREAAVRGTTCLAHARRAAPGRLA